MKILEVFITFTDDEWKTLRSKHSETEIKWLVCKGSDKAVSLECEKIKDDSWSTTTNEEDEAV